MNEQPTTGQTDDSPAPEHSDEIVAAADPGKEPIPKLGEKPAPPKSTGPSAVRFTVRFLLLVMLGCAAYAFWVGSKQRRTSEQLKIVAPLKEYGADINLWKGEVSRISLRFEAADGPFDPEVLAPLAKLPKLKRLVLMDTAANEAMIKEVGKIESLEELLIFNADLNGADLAPLGNLKSLRVLWLCDCRLNDEALDPFETLQALRLVNLNDNQLTDNGLLRLAPLVELEQVNIANNDITDNGVNLVKQTLVNARIIREPIPGYTP